MDINTMVALQGLKALPMSLASPTLSDSGIFSTFPPLSPNLFSPFPVFPPHPSTFLFNSPQTSVPQDNGGEIGRKDKSPRSDHDSLKRRNRTSFSDKQLNCLEKSFRDSQYPDLKARDQLCKDTGLPESKIQVWFKNRRAKHRKHLRNLPLQETKENGESNNAKSTSPTVISWTPETIANLCNPMFFNFTPTLGETSPTHT
ncbi:unnamed protein product [Bursaphelenchus xylophilus]|uniref:(pine wood nematode) hypothetical protein n=1 Tax=Bursaphelenchus xylophilus TaxID=6326 RepID=A0A1I7RIP5_BURXY|nr:unnamed protein product [Bursaphelenchus xylophilus]CAG9118985.1 unnamed protein product [Bursaphelenchus xylophilus]